jgi:hypothetical protein
LETAPRSHEPETEPLSVERIADTRPCPAPDPQEAFALLEILLRESSDQEDA